MIFFMAVLNEAEIILLKKAVKELARELMEIYNSGNFKKKIKTDNSPVTKADTFANKKLCNFLKENFTYPVVSEEDSVIPNVGNGLIWVIDPLDGTKNFIEKGGEFSIIIALMENKRPIFGLVYDVCKGILYFAIKDRGCFKEKNNIIQRCYIDNANADAVMIVSKHHFTESDRIFSKRLRISRFFKRSSIGLKVAGIVDNEANLYLNMDGLNLWDIAGPYLLVKEAGGYVFNKTGNDIFVGGRGTKLRFKEGIFITNMPIKNKTLHILENDLE